MSEQLQKEHNLFKGDKVIYKNLHGHLSTRIIEDVVRISMRGDDEFVAVILEDSDGCYVDFSDIITLNHALDYFGLKMIKPAEFSADKQLGVVGYIVKQE